MNLVQCENGHFYNPALNDSCPVCASANNEHTIPMDGESSAYDGGDIGKTMPVDSVPGAVWDTPMSAPAPTVPVKDPGFDADDENKTQALIKNKMGIDPVVGWLVCVDGPQKGQDYRIHDANNTIGRDAHMDIRIQGDDSITRANQAWLSYDGLNRKFFFGPGDGRNLVYHNDQPVVPGQACPLSAYDRLKMGASTFVFIPMCGEQFNWE